MEINSCDKGLSSPTPTKRPVTPKPSLSDENDQYYQQVGNSNLQRPKKPMTKNYMSPTISAASKAITPKKSILGERNEALEPNFSNIHVENSPIVNGNDSLSQALPLTPSVLKSHDDDDDDEQNGLSDSLSSRPYDPITNYLSPRPRFLRYKPNRLQELFLGLGNGIAERKDVFSASRSGSFESQRALDEEVGAVTTPSSLASPCEDGFIKQEDEEVEVSDEEVEVSDEEIEGSNGEMEGSDEEIEESDGEIEGSDEEIEEVEEDKGWNLKGVLKSLVLLLVVVLFASHISTMNHQTLFEESEDGFCSIQNYTLEAALLQKVENGGNLWDQREERKLGLVEVIKTSTEMGVEEETVVKHESGSEVLGQGEETEMELIEVNERVFDEEEAEDDSVRDIEHADELREVLELQVEEIEAIEVTTQYRGIDELGEAVALQVEDIEEISDQMVVNSEMQNAGIQHYQTPSMSDEVVHQNLVSDVPNTLEEKCKVAVEQIDRMVENKMEGQESFTNMTAEPVMSKTMLESEGNWREELIYYMKSKTFYTAAIWVSIFSVIAASLLLASCFKRRNGVKKGFSVIANPSAKPLVIEQKKINEKVSSPPLKPYSEPLTAEKYNSVLPSRKDDSIDHVYSSFRRMSLSSKHSTEAASEQHYHSQAPTVELLGEFVVGEVSSSLRSCCMKNKMPESEDSNYSVSSRKKLGSKVHSVSIPSQPAASEFSSMVSPSHGSYTPQNMKKKEGGKDGEVTTPLRRSTRLRNRAVMSP